jgi:hypothetical protein
VHCVDEGNAALLNLPPPPPQFRGLDPDKPIRVYQRHLPHWRQDGATYFVTFRLGDALPQEKLDFLKRLRDEWERMHPPPRSEHDWEEHTREIVRRAEAWLDQGYGSCCFRESRHAEQMEEALRHFQDERYFVSCYVVMPNHCHAVLRPFAGRELEDILQGMIRSRGPPSELDNRWQRLDLAGGKLRPHHPRRRAPVALPAIHRP